MRRNLAGHPAGTLVFATPNNNTTLARQAKTGEALRLTKGVYAVGSTLPPEATVRHHKLAVIDHFWPGGVLCGANAIAGGEPRDGWIYVAHTGEGRKRKLELPGLTVRGVLGPGPLPGDVALPGGVYLSGDARQLVESIVVRGRPAGHQGGVAVVEERIDLFARTGGSGRIARILGQLDVIAGSFDPVAVDAVRRRLAAVLGTFDDGLQARNPSFASRISGAPVDSHRLELLAGVIETVRRRAPHQLVAQAGDPRWEWSAFFEAYFSNFIEGTRFSVEEARAIAIDDVVPAARPQDAHDVAATYRLIHDPSEREWVPRNATEFVDGLARRHSVLMSVREDMRPGQFKDRPNFAGGYRFVEPESVLGTLREGFDQVNSLVDPFARSVATMVLITEVHPFDDGNGRLARLCANAELSAAGQVRLVLPNVFRNNYLSALSAMSNQTDHGEALIAVLDFVQRWSAAVDWSTFATADRHVTESNGYLDAAQAEGAGVRLVLPT